MEQEKTSVQFLPINNEITRIFNHIYNRLSIIQPSKEYSKFQSTNITGIYDGSRFLVYKDPEEINKICIILINDEDEIMICLNSEDIENYFDKCNYYSEYKTNKSFYTESKGLGKKSKEYCKFNWNSKTRNYSLCFKQEENKYKYIMTLKDSQGESQVICTWDNFEQFMNNEKPKEIEVSDEMKCIKSNFTITNHNSYNSGNSDNSYEEIEKLIKELGLSLKCDSPKRYVRIGISLEEGISEIIKRYIKEMKMSHEQLREKRTEELNEKLLNRQSKINRLNIIKTETENPQLNKDTQYLIARDSIEQNRQRGSYIKMDNIKERPKEDLILK
jgi:hypothetical protein